MHYDTVYFGGGTPSLLTPSQTEKILSHIRSYYQISDNAEITIECNPGTAEIKFLKEYAEQGFNRLSLGVQSFNDGELKFLQRIHAAAEVYSAYNMALSAGFDNIGIDLIFGIPEQTLESWQHSLFSAVSLKPSHISAYSLTYEQGTPLFKAYQRGIIKTANEILEEEMFLLAHGYLESAGYEHYEISNYSLPGRRSRHNSNYWNRTEYLALGPSANGFDGSSRYWNYSDTERYAKMCLSAELPVEGSEFISTNELIEEIIMLGIRSLNMDLSKLQRLMGNSSFVQVCKYLNELMNSGIIHIDGDIAALTPSGMLLSNEITGKLFSLID